MSGNKPADESVKRPPLGVCDAHALVDYGAHVKYPGCENWRPIEPSAPVITAGTGAPPMASPPSWSKPVEDEPSALAAARYVSVAWIERVIVDLERKAHTLSNPGLIAVAVETLKAFLPGEPLHPPDAAIDARLAAGERGIPKIPDGPDTRHAVPSAPDAPANALRSEWQSRLQLLQSLELGVYSELSPADRDTVKTWLVDVQVRLALLDVPPNAADNAGRCAHGVWLADHCHECTKIVAAECAAAEEAVRIVDRMTCHHCYAGMKLQVFPGGELEHVAPITEHRYTCFRKGRAIVAALVAEGWGKK